MVLEVIRLGAKKSSDGKLSSSLLNSCDVVLAMMIVYVCVCELSQYGNFQECVLAEADINKRCQQQMWKVTYFLRSWSWEETRFWP